MIFLFALSKIDFVPGLFSWLYYQCCSLQAHADPEYKVNKRSFEVKPSQQFSCLSNMSSVGVYSSLFPTVPVMINWHGQRCLSYLKVWLRSYCDMLFFSFFSTFIYLFYVFLMLKFCFYSISGLSMLQSTSIQS